MKLGHGNTIYSYWELTYSIAIAIKYAFSAPCTQATAVRPGGIMFSLSLSCIALHHSRGFVELHSIPMVRRTEEEICRSNSWYYIPAIGYVRMYAYLVHSSNRN